MVYWILKVLFEVEESRVGDQSLLFQMIARMSIAATLAFILSQIKLFRRVSYRNVSWFDKVKLAFIFGLVGIGGTYVGIPVSDALANSRAIGVMAAGLVGGPVVGVGAGIIAGGHRFLLGGFTAFACALSSITEGLLSGLVKKKFPNRPIQWEIALLAGVIGESAQMIIILLFAEPYEQALSLVGDIAVPMTLTNSLGLAIFMLIIKTVIDDQNRVGAIQAQKVLRITAKTLPHFRRGLNQESAEATARIIYKYGGYHAVAVTDTKKVLAFIGAEADHHLTEKRHFTKSTSQVIETGTIYIAANAAEVGCDHPGCKLQSAIIVPLKSGTQIVGAFKLYYTVKELLSQTDIVFAQGLAQLLSVQLELAELERESKQAAQAELKALQAQINPHFLFNTLNTIISMVRLDPMLARELLIKLSEIFRFTLHKTGKEILLSEELHQVKAYLTIEKARYGDKLQFKESIEINPSIYMIASLTIQPLVENAIKHGLKPKKDGGTIFLQIVDVKDHIEIHLEDDGVGFSLEQVNPLEFPREGHIGLRNVHERLRSQYGASYGLKIESELNVGTKITIHVPKLLWMEGAEHAENFNCG
jgi:two-component system sensor histidine kinase LytS